jgi:cytochrome c-type biogenesis protein CcmF
VVSSAIGYLGIITAFASAIALVVHGFRGLRDADRAVPGRTRLPVLGIVAGSVAAMLALEIGLLTDDFSVEYVANHSASTTPFLFKVASAWGALEGSIILWLLVLALFTYVVWRSHRSRGDGDRLGNGALLVMGVVVVFFVGLVLTISNPFRVCVEARSVGCAVSSSFPFSTAVAPLEGFGPNPLLQNHILMAVHPPLLYVGYIGLTVPFAFALSALILGQSGVEWLERTRRWTLVAWIFLTAGIILGGLWSYEVLGWGGYWAWDPVENASFLPWLVATAFLHSAVVQVRRGMLQAWNFILVIAAFSLTILGTFLTRSGVIVSVHSFTQSAVGPALLWFLTVVLVVSLAVFAARIHLVASSPRIDSLLSREGAFLLNNLLLTLFAFVVLAGTLYPMIVELVTGTQVGVGRPFFERLGLPISLLLVLAMAIGSVTPYRAARPAVMWERLRTPLRLSLAVTAVGVLVGARNGWILVTTLLSAFVVAVAVRHLWSQALRSARGVPSAVPGAAVRLMRNDAGYWGGQIAHIGVAALALGIALSSNLAVEDQVRFAPGESVGFAGFELTYVEPFERVESNREVLGARVEIRRGGDVVSVLEPRLNNYFMTRQAIATPSVDLRLRGDLYLSLTSIDADGATLDVFWFPYIWLIWLGGALAVGGGVWAWLVPRARRREADPETAEVARA